MAHDTRRLRRYASVPLSGGRNAHFFAYATDNTAAETIAAGYFNESRGALTVGSIIDAVVNFAGAADNIRLRVTAVPSAGNVTVSYEGVAAGS